MTQRIFEFDDYPWGRRHFLKMVDWLHEQYPNFKCNVFAVPAMMTPRSWREIRKRPFLRINPHGFTHQKRECRFEWIYTKHLGLLEEIAKDQRWSKVFKAPWHGYSTDFIHRLYDLGFIPATRSLRSFPTPMPEGWKIWNSSDALAEIRAKDADDGGMVIEAHPVYPREGRLPYKAMATEISMGHVKRWSRHWQPDDQWVFVEDLVRPALLKLHLGCGKHVWDGWVNLDPRYELHEKIIDWDFSRQLPFSECKADIVFTSHVFNYVHEDNYEEALLEIWRVLRPDGILRMSEDRTDSGYIWRKPGQRARGTGTILSLPTQQKIELALKRVGFKVVPASPETTLSPHKDVLQGNSREDRYKAGQKFYVEAIKDCGPLEDCDVTRVRRWDPRATLANRYLLPPPTCCWHPQAKT